MSGWVLHVGADNSWWHCDRAGYWEDDEIYCSKCQTPLVMNYQAQTIKSVIQLIKNNLCFDALADVDGRCANHNGKCYELGLLIKQLEESITE